METDIIIPIYNAFQYLADCINSVIRHTDLQKHTLLLINDKSTDPKVLPLLESVVAQHKGLNIHLINNPQNMGFVRTVNTGMQYSEHDVVLLNSDTEVTERWLDKIQHCAYSKPCVATVTPLSNNATLASVPDFLIENTLPEEAKYWQTLLYIVIVLSITVANLFAIRQKNLKRFLAFSSISQAGYIMLAVISGTPYGMTSLIFYVLVYMVANLAAFGVISAVEQNTGGKVGMDDYNGLYRTNPKLAVIMTLALFSLAGIPPFAGFFSKFFIFAAAFEEGFHVLVLIALLNTIISLYYYLLVVKAMFITPNDSPIPTFRSDSSTRLSLLLCLAGILALGIASSVFDGINLYTFGM